MCNVKVTQCYLIPKGKKFRISVKIFSNLEQYSWDWGRLIFKYNLNSFVKEDMLPAIGTQVLKKVNMQLAEKPSKILDGLIQ